MNISRIGTTILRVPLGEERFCSSQCAFPERHSLLVRIETDTGLVRWGEGGQYGPPEPVAAAIGQAIAVAFAEEGADLVIADLKPARETVAALRKLGADARAYRVDVTDERQVVRLFRKLPRLDILVKNAGTYGPVKKIVDMDRAAWDRPFALNLTAAMLCAREAVRKMTPRHSGNIVNIASNVARRGLPYRGCCVATKWALLGLTQTLALETAADHIRVNAILPGPVPTPHLDGVMKIHARVEGRAAADVAEDWRTCAPVKRFVAPEEVGRVAVFLASALSSAMTGQGLNVTGGFIMT
ncbi:MAG: SDR family oxidoreductase [Kiritimatiellae bacterium]|nr:SDR family oxidoreductase [Kiritimatiellia bacterium]